MIRTLERFYSNVLYFFGPMFLGPSPIFPWSQISNVLCFEGLVFSCFHFCHFTNKGPVSTSAILTFRCYFVSKTTIMFPRSYISNVLYFLDPMFLDLVIASFQGPVPYFQDPIFPSPILLRSCIPKVLAFQGPIFTISYVSRVLFFQGPKLSMSYISIVLNF